MTLRTDFEGRSIDIDKLRKQARVSDRAVLRFIERELGFPVEKIRAQLLSDTVLQAMALNAASVRAHGYDLVIAPGSFTVTTVLTAPKHIRRSRRRKPRWHALQGQG